MQAFGRLSESGSKRRQVGLISLLGHSERWLNYQVLFCYLMETSI